jgi:hypothetical protein
MAPNCWDPLGTNDEIAPTLVQPITAPTTGTPMKITSQMAMTYPEHLSGVPGPLSLRYRPAGNRQRSRGPGRPPDRC